MDISIWNLSYQIWRGPNPDLFGFKIPSAPTTDAPIMPKTGKTYFDSEKLSELSTHFTGSNFFASFSTMGLKKSQKETLDSDP